MSESLSLEHARSRPPYRAERSAPSLVTRYGASLLYVAAATTLAFILERQVGAPNLTLIFVLPVIAAASTFGWGPSLFATVASVLSFDFFFTEPRYSLAIDSPADMWAAALLLVIAAVVSAISAESRRRELAARQAAEQAQALQALAHVVVQSAPTPQIVSAAATALNSIFRAPAVIFMDRSGAFEKAAASGGARITPAEHEAAKGVLESRLHARAEAYPYHRSLFDFWPVESPSGCHCVIGVSFGRSRPEAPERFIEIVAAYLAIALEC